MSRRKNALFASGAEGLREAAMAAKRAELGAAEAPAPRLPPNLAEFHHARVVAPSRVLAAEDGVEHDVLADMDLLREHRARIHGTNPVERLNGANKRRTDGVRILSNEDAITRLTGAILLEQSDERATGRARCMTLETNSIASGNPTVSLPAVAA